MGFEKGKAIRKNSNIIYQKVKIEENFSLQKTCQKSTDFKNCNLIFSVKRAIVGAKRSNTK